MQTIIAELLFFKTGKSRKKSRGFIFADWRIRFLADLPKKKEL